MDHYFVYQREKVALAAMQRQYVTDSLMPWVNNPEANAGVLINSPLTLESELEWYDSLAKRSGSDVVFAILVNEGQEKSWRYVGHTGLHGITWPAARASTGTFIGDTGVRQKGYGTEAKLLLLNHAFHVLGLRKITSEAKAFNGKSYGHLLRCGYQVVGRRRLQHFHDGGYVDDILFEVFREEFEPIWKAYCETGELPRLTNEQRTQITKDCGEKK